MTRFSVCAWLLLLFVPMAVYAQKPDVSFGTVRADTMRFGDGTTQTTASSINGLLYAPVYNVKAYGALGDGATEDSTAIKATLVAGAGKTIYFPAGTYLCGAALTVSTNSTTVYLERGATVRLTGADKSLFTVSADSVVFTGHGTIDGGYDLHTAEVFAIDFLPGCASVTVEGLTVRRVAFSAVHAYQVENLTVQNCTIDSTGGPGIVAYTVTGGLIQGNRISYNTLWPSAAEQPCGIAAQVACSKVRIIGNDISTDAGTLNTSAITVNGTECTIANNVIRLYGDAFGISVALSKWVTVSGNTVIGGSASNIGSIEAANDTAVTIQGNTVKGNLNVGITLNSNNLGINVIGNAVDSCKLGIAFDGGGASRNHNVSNNVVTRCWNTGIYLNNTGRRSVVTGNTIRPAAGGHGIANIGTDYLTITNNNIDSTSDAWGIVFDTNVTGCLVLGNVIAYSTYGKMSITTGLGNLVAGTTDNDTTLTATTNIGATDFIASGEYHKGTPGTMGSLKIKNIGQYTGIWVDTATATPTVTNYSFLTDYSLGETILNAPVNGKISLRIGNEAETATVNNKGIGSGTTYPYHRFSGVVNSTVPYGLNITHSGYNKNLLAAWEESDSACINISFTPSGKPELVMRGPDGEILAKIDSAGSLIIAGSLTGSATTRGSDAFATTAEHDTVAVTGASVSDFYCLQITGTSIPGANDNLTVEATATGFIVHRAASGTSGLTYSWMRMQ